MCRSLKESLPALHLPSRAPPAKGGTGTLQMGQLRLLHPIPMSQFSPRGVEQRHPPPLYIISGCLCPVASSPPPLLLFHAKWPLPRAQAPTCVPGSPAANTGTSFSPLPLNFNFVVTECPCVLTTEYVSGSAVPETWPTWSSEGQGNQSSGTSFGSQLPSTQSGTGTVRVTSCGPVAAPTCIPIL